jgi:hypothetical protein
MDTVEFTPFCPRRWAGALAGGAAGIVLGVCGTATLVSAQSADDEAAQPARTLAASGVAPQPPAAPRQLRAVDCRVLALTRRASRASVPRSADAMAGWIAQIRADNQRR